MRVMLRDLFFSLAAWNVVGVGLPSWLVSVKVRNGKLLGRIFYFNSVSYLLSFGIVCLSSFRQLMPRALELPCS